MHDNDDDVVDTVAVIVAHDQLSEEHEGRHGGSRAGRGPNIRRDFSGGCRRILLDYFWDEASMRNDGSRERGPVYSAELFERRFRMSKDLLLRVCEGVM